jgi:guanine deaminase
VLLRAPLLWSGGPGRLLHEADGGLLVGPEGRIEASGPFAEVSARRPGAKAEDLRPCWILPGLIDLHTHLPQYEAVALDGLELLPWLETHVFPAEVRFADPVHARSVAQGFIRDLLSFGTTTACLYGTVHVKAADAMFRVADDAGIRAVIGKAMMDRNAPRGLLEDTEESLRGSEELCQTWHGRDHGRLAYAFTPRFAPACSAELMGGAGALAAKHDAFIQTHISENLQEIEWVRQLFPLARTYAEVYDHFGLLGPRTLLGHGIHLSPGERDLLRRHGATVVHCPSSNAFLRSGIMPLRRWVEEGLSVGLGTDVGAGPRLSLFDEMAMACTASKLRWAGQRNQAARIWGMDALDDPLKLRLCDDLDLEPDGPLDASGAFHLATRGGAAALGLGDRIGGLEAGLEADLIVVDPRLTSPGGAVDTDPARVLSRLVYRADPGMVRASFVRGRRCFSREG